jgi:glutathione S-transferase
MSSGFLLQVGGIGSAAVIFESFVLRKYFQSIYVPSKSALALPRSYSTVILVNVVGSTVVLMILGIKVSISRRAMKEKAIKNGDVDAEARFSYPKLYAEGFSEEAREFNCVQRAHQHAFETYPQFLTLSIIGGLHFPVLTTCAGALWNYARLKWAESYSSKGPEKRYEHWASTGIWVGLLLELFASVGTAVYISDIGLLLKK